MAKKQAQWEQQKASTRNRSYETEHSAAQNLENSAQNPSYRPETTFRQTNLVTGTINFDQLNMGLRKP